MRRPRLSDEGGFSLPELLLTMVIGLVVIGSGTMITIGAQQHNAEVVDRTDATGRGRYAMDQIEQILRSQACSDASPFSVTAATPNSITVYTDLSDGSTPVVRHTLTYTPATKTLTDVSVRGSTTTPQTFTGAARTVTLATDVIPDGTTPIFRYWAYPDSAPASGSLSPTVELLPPAAGLSATDLGRVSRIDIDFTATGTNANTQQSIHAEMADQVFVRLADPNATTDFDPSCS